MNVKQVKDIARQWVVEEAGQTPGFFGAFFGGSISLMPDDAPFPPSSDVNVILVSEKPDIPPTGMGLAVRQHIPIDIAYLESKYFASPDWVLGAYPYAVHFIRPNIILDPTGQLTRIQEVVAREYARRKWVRQRCEQVRDDIQNGFAWLKESDPLHDQAAAQVGPLCVPTFLFLVADLRNPTVRKMYVGAREVLAKYHELELYEPLLELLGCARMSRAEVESHLAALVQVFDVAKTIARTPYFGVTLLNDVFRSKVVDASYELIKAGLYREVVWWIMWIHSCCQKTLFLDAPVEVKVEYAPGYRRLMEDLGLATYAEIKRRHEQVKEFLPRAWGVVDKIIATNPEIID